MTNIDPNKSYFFSWIICLLFVLTYGTFLYITSDILELRHVEWSVITLLYSIPLFIALLIIYKPIKEDGLCHMQCQDALFLIL